MRNVIIPFTVMISTLMLIINCKGDKTSINKKISIEKVKKKRILIEIIIDDSSHPIYWKSVINHNSNGKIKEEKHYDRGNIFHSKYEYKYNDFGDIIEWSILNSKSELTQQTKYFYDSSRKLIKEQMNILNEDDSYTVCLYNYDSMGKLKSIDIENSHTYKHEFIYDKKDILKAKIFYNSDGTKSIENYDEFGRRKGDKNNIIKYDDKNNIIEEIHEYTDGLTKFTNKYKFNKQGEWIEIKTYLSTDRNKLGELRNTQTRQIKYFPF
jgi:hypothetical protein